MPTRVVLLVLAVISSLPLLAQSPTVYFHDRDYLVSEKQRLARAKAGDKTLAAIHEIASSEMKVGPYSVTEKEVAPPSGDKHDFLSMSPYWWPDPKSPDGLPYIRRDGERNPEAAKIPDRDTFALTAHAAYTLSLAYYLTGKAEYGARASLLLRTWFLDPKTRMNPNMNHGQYVRGRDTGRGSGLIESRHLVLVIDALGLLKGSPAWRSEDQQGMVKWFSDYFEWLKTSKNGKREIKAPNNHGTWFEVQFLAIALFLNRESDVAESLVRAKSRIASEIEPDGRQPRELQRTKAMQYSTFNLLALTHLAREAEAAKADLWKYNSSDGRSIRKALDWLLPYVLQERKWEYKQIVPFNPDEIVQVLYWAAAKYRAPEYAAAARKLSPPPHDLDSLLLGNMTFAEQPVRE